MDGHAPYTIGDLARRTGLSIRTIRFYSDDGLLPPTGRSPAGHRRYDLAALARLELVRTLRDLGVDLATIRRVLRDELTVAQAAAAHADALEVQIRTLRLRRAVLRVVAERGAGPEEVDFMHRLARLSEAERHRLIHDFVDSTFGGVDANPEFVALLRSAMPDLPDEPSVAQVDAWIELAELVQDPDFRASVRRIAEFQAAERAAGDDTGLHGALTDEVRDRVEAARAAGVDPASPPAAPVVADLVDRYARVFGTTDSREYRGRLLTRLLVANDPRTERYWQLIAVINGWPTAPSLAPVFAWFIEALRCHPEP